MSEHAHPHGHCPVHCAECGALKPEEGRYDPAVPPSAPPDVKFVLCTACITAQAAGTCIRCKSAVALQGTTMCTECWHTRSVGAQTQAAAEKHN